MGGEDNKDFYQKLFKGKEREFTALDEEVPVKLLIELSKGNEVGYQHKLFNYINSFSWMKPLLDMVLPAGPTAMVCHDQFKVVTDAFNAAGATIQAKLPRFNGCHDISIKALKDHKLDTYTWTAETDVSDKPDPKERAIGDRRRLPT